MLIRRYAPADRAVVRLIHTLAFGGEVEPALFEALVDAGDVIPALSLVAARDGEPIGHVMCSRATVGEHEVVALGPIGVLPAHQREGVGRALVHAVLAAADALDAPLVALLGSTAYYPRFGFVPATSVGIESPNASWGDDFQVRTLSAYRPGITGRFRYAPPFDAV